MMRLRLLIICLFCGISCFALPSGKDFQEVSDSIAVLLEQRTSVRSTLSVRKVLRRGGKLDFYFDRSLGDWPWHEGDIKWLTQILQNLMPQAYKSYKVGEIFCDRIALSALVTPVLNNDGKAIRFSLSSRAPCSEHFVTRVGEQQFSKGLSGRNIALWQSHGRYFDAYQDRWRWQRPPVHRTCEDIFTQTYVLPFLIPMLENAGAYVMTPRERDTNADEYIIDNDPAFGGQRKYPLRAEGRYAESAGWTDAGVGFADACREYFYGQNPFTMGSARRCPSVREGRGRKAAISWSADIRERGEYAVYVSYKTLPESTGSAHYSVKHMGGTTDFYVNQRMGGGTWVYLGTFEFSPQDGACVTLDNTVPAAYRLRANETVTADAVKIGGGMGKIARGRDDADSLLFRTSGLPSYLEGALYWMQWAGVDTTITSQWEGDYTRDYASRGAWVASLSSDKGIPVDLSLAVHSDAGTTPNDSIVGTLAIYTYRAEEGVKLPDGRSRMVSRTYADLVQSQIVSDMRALYDTLWQRRELWDRSYSESRTTKTPALLLEMFSHQNFADMRLAHDPSFKFAMCRAVYKGLLKYLSAQYGVPYMVQPLPVKDFRVVRRDGRAHLEWCDCEDPLENGALPSGYILYTRIADGAFDEGKVIQAKGDGARHWIDLELPDTQLRSYRIVAFNDGGRSFPSETLCIGGPADGRAVLIVNNFTRLSAPAWFDAGPYAGFNAREDGGVPYMRDFSYAGENYEYQRVAPWLSDDNAGFGASATDRVGTMVEGNTFDFVSVHAAALLQAGYSVGSSSASAFTRDGGDDAFFAVDLLCGKQLATVAGRGYAGSFSIDGGYHYGTGEDSPANGGRHSRPDRESPAVRYEVFPARMQEVLRSWVNGGGRLVVSGANIATDLNTRIYPALVDSAAREDGLRFAREVLGYEWISGHASTSGTLSSLGCAGWRDFSHALEFGVCNTLGGSVYCVENPDAIAPARGSGASVLLRYSDTCMPAAVRFIPGENVSREFGRSPRVCSFGFPLECIDDRSLLPGIFKLALD